MMLTLATGQININNLTKCKFCQVGGGIIRNALRLLLKMADFIITIAQLASHRSFPPVQFS